MVFVPMPALFRTCHLFKYGFVLTGTPGLRFQRVVSFTVFLMAVGALYVCSIVVGLTGGGDALLFPGIFTFLYLTCQLHGDFLVAVETRGLFIVCHLAMWVCFQLYFNSTMGQCTGVLITIATPTFRVSILFSLVGGMFHGATICVFLVVLYGFGFRDHRPLGRVFGQCVGTCDFFVVFGQYAGIGHRVGLGVYAHGVGFGYSPVHFGIKWAITTALSGYLRAFQGKLIQFCGHLYGFTFLL